MSNAVVVNVASSSANEHARENAVSHANVAVQRNTCSDDVCGCGFITLTGVAAILMFIHCMMNGCDDYKCGWGCFLGFSFLKN